MTRYEQAHRIFVIVVFALVFRTPTDSLWLLFAEVCIGLLILVFANRLSRPS